MRKAVVLLGHVEEPRGIGEPNCNSLSFVQPFLLIVRGMTLGLAWELVRFG